MMVVRSNKASKYGKSGRRLYCNREFINVLSNIVLNLSLMGLMFSMGLCYSGECAYVQETNPLTMQVLTVIPSNYLLAEIIQNITTWLVIAYVGLGIWNYKLKKGGKK